MATLHFTCGRAGAGKTTLARELGRQLSAVVICEDEWISHIADPVHSLGEYLNAARHVRQVLAPHVIALLRLGVSVVFDFAGNTPQDRLWVKFIFDSAGAGHTLHYLPLDEETCRARVRQRNEAKPPGVFFGEVTPAQLDQVNKYFVPPAADEGFIVVRHESR